MSEKDKKMNASEFGKKLAEKLNQHIAEQLGKPFATDWSHYEGLEEIEHDDFSAYEHDEEISFSA